MGGWESELLAWRTWASVTAAASTPAHGPCSPLHDLHGEETCSPLWQWGTHERKWYSMVGGIPPDNCCCEMTPAHSCTSLKSWLHLFSPARNPSAQVLTCSRTLSHSGDVRQSVPFCDSLSDGPLSSQARVPSKSQEWLQSLREHRGKGKSNANFFSPVFPCYSTFLRR